MTPAEALDDLARRCGILPVYRDMAGTERRTTPDTQRALLRAMGLVPVTDALVVETARLLASEADERRYPHDLIAEAGQPFSLDAAPDCVWQIVWEDGGTGEGRGPFGHRSLPMGLHRLTIGGETVTLIAAPGSAPSVSGKRGRGKVWGVTGALYGLRSARNGGLGDYADLGAAGAALGRAGAAFLGINPIHDLGWGNTEDASPYSPSHRGFLNTAHIATDRLAGSEGPEAANPAGDLVDYAAHRGPHRARLRGAFAHFRAHAAPEDRAAFAAFRAERGAALEQFAAFEALSSRHGPDWRHWPADPGAADPAEAEFHAWLQWVADCQVGAASAEARAAGLTRGLYLDLAVGARRGGAEAWCTPDAIAAGMSLGAPPDHLNPQGQNWQVTAFAPAKLRATGFAAFRAILAASMRHAGILRIDHILGLNRGFWIPDDGSPGAYVGQPFEALLAIVAIEAARHGTVVIGEDLGLVPGGVRQGMARRGIYSYSVLQYERTKSDRLRSPKRLRANSLACFATHDTPTLRGFAEGRDIDWWQRLGWTMPDEAAKARKARARDVARLCASNGAAPGALRDGVHAALAGSPAALVSVQLDDLDGAAEAQNLPGTIDEHPNWRRRYTRPVESFADWPAFCDTAAIMRRNGR